MVYDVQEAAPSWTIPEFTAWLNDHTSFGTPPAISAITLATMHAAKGFE